MPKVVAKKDMREDRLQVYLSKDERRTINAFAKEVGLDPTTYTRLMALQKIQVPNAILKTSKDMA